jgi:tripartite-type tricarboxylate transporter receptor subunit TctC
MRFLRRRTVVTRLNSELACIVGEPDVTQRLIAQGADPQSSTLEGLAEFLRADFERQRKVIAYAGLKYE